MSVLGEIKRRKVFQVAAVYAVVAWILVQIVSTVEEPLSLPDWFDTAIIVFLAAGFPITLIVSWAFDVTSEGLIRDNGSVAQTRGRTIEHVLIGLLVFAVGALLYREFSPPGELVEAVPTIRPNSVAVLPFTNVSPNPDDAYFAVGLHEEVLNQLSKLSNLSVISHTSVLRYRDSGLSVPQIASELNVGTVMEGSVRYAAGRIRVTTQLIDAANDQHLWSETYEREFEDIFAIESDIAANVANALKVELSLQEQESIEQPPTESTEAYALYLKGRYFWNIRTELAIQTALDYFQQAVKLDPSYALAYSGIGDVWVFRSWYSVLAPNETGPQAIEAVRTALDYNENLAEAHASLAHMYFQFEYDWAAAETEYLRAIELNHRYPITHHWYGGYLSSMQRHDEALKQAHTARRLNPVSPIINTWVGLRHYFAGRFPAAIEEYEKALELNPDFAPAHWHLGWALEQTGQYDAAVASAERAMAISENPIYLASLAHSYAKAGNADRAKQILDQLDRISMTRYVSAYHTAAIHVALGDVDEGFRWLEQAYTDRSSWIGYMRVDPRLDLLRSDSRFDTILRQANLDF